MQKVLKPFNFAAMKTVDQFSQIMNEAGFNYPYSKDLSILHKPIQLESKIIRNRLLIHPLEGFDGTSEGAPTELVYRRYKRYAIGGAGIIWYESFAVSEDGRCNPLQMIIKESTIKDIKRLVAESDKAATNSLGEDSKPYNIIQLTHSGRRSVDANWNSTPLAVTRNPYIDHHNSIDGSSGDLTIASDEKIEEIIQAFIDSSELSVEAGFDSIDIKICHEYILRELLSAFTRTGKYGGSFENRSRAIFETIDGIKKRVGNDIDICVRLNAYDAIPYPYGWGMVKEDGVMKPDLSEPIKLCRMLVERGVRLINISTMMPRYQPYGRGYLAEMEGSEINPYAGTYYLLKATKEIKDAVPEAVLVSTGLSWLQQFVQM